MPVFTTIPVNDASNESIDTFGGYNHNMKIGDGEFFDMKNLGSDEYPLLANRRKRGIASEFLLNRGDVGTKLKDVRGTATDTEGNLWIVAKGVYEPNEYGITDDTQPKLFKINKGHTSGDRYKVIEDYSYYCNVLDDASESAESTQFVLSDDAKNMFITGDSIYIFPDKKWVRLATAHGTIVGTYTTWGNMNAVFGAVPFDTPIVYSPCDSEGNVYTGQTASASAPENPTEGMIWVDTSGVTHVWKKYAGTSWITIPDVYIKISYDGVGMEFNAGDGINITTYSEEAGVSAVNGSHVIIKNGYSYIVITGIIDDEVSQSDGNIRIERAIPDMDYVIMAQNRLWGCKFTPGDGVSDGINEIYASKLGDFNNWNVFQGISTDSYVASVGTPGKWTGAANINGYPTFFKEDHYHKVYVSSSGAHQIIDKPCHGAQDACGGSVVVVGDICYYKSKNGVMAFDGSSFSNIGAAFGRERYVAADGGAVGDKYYISMQNESGEWAIFAYDTRRGLWHKEDNTHALFFCNAADDAIFITEDAEGNATVNITSEYDTASTYEGDIEWEAITGLQGYGYTGQKYISRFNLRMQLPRGSNMDVFVEYNSDGVWHHQGHIKGTGTRSFVLPVRPRRCDHFRIKLSGKGDVRIYSFARYFEGGSDII